MKIADEIQKLQELHASGALTDVEFSQAKARVLNGQSSAFTSSTVPMNDEKLRHIQLQHEIAALDREWQIEREKYFVTGRYGSRFIPTEVSSLVGALVIGGFGIFWTISAASAGAPPFFSVFGVVFVVLGVGSCLNSYRKAGEYQKAEQRYDQRRSKLTSQMRNHGL
jgi:hypothetical protein